MTLIERLNIMVDMALMEQKMKKRKSMGLLPKAFTL